MKSKKMLATAAKKAAKGALRSNANAATCGLIYQPKVPKDLKKFSRITP